MIMPKAETPFTDAPPVTGTIGLLVGTGGTPPVEATVGEAKPVEATYVGDATAVEEVGHA